MSDDKENSLSTVTEVSLLLGSVVSLPVALAHGGKDVIETFARKFRVNMDEVIVRAILDELPRLARLMKAINAEKINPEEALEIAGNVVRRYPETLSREKRQLMSNVLVNGFAQAEWDAARSRYFVNAIIALDVEHVAVLRSRAEETLLRHDDTFRPEAGTRDAGYVHQLAQWQFVASGTTMDDVGMFTVTPLGMEFLTHLWDPETGPNKHVAWADMVRLKRACSSINMWGKPRYDDHPKYEIDEKNHLALAVMRNVETGQDERLTLDDVRALHHGVKVF